VSLGDNNYLFHKRTLSIYEANSLSEILFTAAQNSSEFIKKTAIITSDVQT